MACFLDIRKIKLPVANILAGSISGLLVHTASAQLFFITKISTVLYSPTTTKKLAAAVLVGKRL